MQQWPNQILYIFTSLTPLESDCEYSNPILAIADSFRNRTAIKNQTSFEAPSYDILHALFSRMRRQTWRLA